MTVLLVVFALVTATVCGVAASAPVSAVAWRLAVAAVVAGFTAAVLTLVLPL